MEHETPSPRVRYSYLPQQFAEIDEIFDELRRFVPTGDFTLGKPLDEFERRFAELIGTRHAIGVGSGTDALKLSLKAIGIAPGDEVITAANTFIATVGAINEVGARPIFVDCDDSFCIDVDQVEAAIGPRTRAIMPVHFTGEMPDMATLAAIAEAHRLPLVEDACQGILAAFEGRNAGTWGVAAGFSLHPLKNLNVWGDAGVVVTSDDALDARLRLLRNHGLRNRDEIEILGYNSRLDSVQAIVGNWLIGDAALITARRIANAAYYDRRFDQIPQIRVPPRRPQVRRVFHLYMVFAEERDALYDWCLARGVEAKIHYPIPLYLQEGLKHYGHKPGDFPVTDRHAREIISFPADQHLTREQQDLVTETVKSFYAGG
ncbi:MAG: DegT/DnrJ/EryC1/StrS family aminotransferase [Alphaproteobacteria bacterium]|nr:DegT/DnrJ/EryC1/StrS family aminotransferase [Alphaproteobacteria bacterium]